MQKVEASGFKLNDSLPIASKTKQYLQIKQTVRKKKYRLLSLLIFVDNRNYTHQQVPLFLEETAGN